MSEAFYRDSDEIERRFEYEAFRNPTYKRIRRLGYLETLDWTRPAVDLIDEVAEFLLDTYDADELNYDEAADWADRIVTRRLK